MPANKPRPNYDSKIYTFIKITSVFVLFLGTLISIAPRIGNTSHDPDTWMRLAFIEQCLTDYFSGYADSTHLHTGGFIGHLTQYWYRRDGAGYGGMALHWTLPYDLFVTVVTLPFLANHADVHQALEKTRLIIGPLSLLVAIWACWLMASTFSPRRTKAGIFVWVSLFIPAATVLSAYILSGRVSHHGLSFALAILSFACVLRFLRYPRPSRAFFSGLTIVLAMWCSIETLPFELLTFFVLWAGCLWRGQSPVIANRLNINLIILFATAVCLAGSALLIDPPFEGWSYLRTDRYSIIHIALLLLCGVCVYVCRVYTHRHPQTTGKTKFLVLCAVTILFCAVGGGGIALLAPPPVNTADPVFRLYYFNHIMENRNLLTDGERSDLVFIIPQIIALLIWFRLIWRKRHRPQVWAISIVGLILCATTALGLLHLRLGSYAGGLSAIICALAVRHALARRHPEADGDLLMAFFMLFMGIFLIVETYVSKAPSWTKPHSTDTCMFDSQVGAQIVKALGPNANLMNEIWLGPLLIWETLPTGGVNVVAGPYHPNTKGIHDLGILWTTDDTQPQGHKAIRAIIEQRHLTGLVLCVADSHVSNTVLPETSIAHILRTGHLPSWIQPIPLMGAPNIRAFRILPDAQTTLPHTPPPATNGH